MKFSLKLVLLATALCSVTLAWIRVRQQMLAAETQQLRNTGWNEGQLRATEANGEQSYLTCDAAGVFHMGRITGPRGIELLDQGRPDVQITSLSLGSAEAMNLLTSGMAPDLKSLYLDDVDYSQVSFANLDSFPKLSLVKVRALENEPFSALSTLPSFKKPVTLVFELPDDSDPRLAKLKERLAGLTIIIATDDTR